MGTEIWYRDVRDVHLRSSAPTSTRWATAPSSQTKNPWLGSMQRQVTEYELHRNMVIAAVQGNQSPLIDHPDRSDAIDFQRRPVKQRSIYGPPTHRRGCSKRS